MSAPIDVPSWKNLAGTCPDLSFLESKRLAECATDNRETVQTLIDSTLRMTSRGYQSGYIEHNLKQAAPADSGVPGAIMRALEGVDLRDQIYVKAKLEVLYQEARVTTKQLNDRYKVEKLAWINYVKTYKARIRQREVQNGYTRSDEEDWFKTRVEIADSLME